MTSLFHNGISLLIFSILLVSCTRDQREAGHPPPPFQVHKGIIIPYDSTREVTGVLFHRFSIDTTLYALVTSRERSDGTDSLPAPLFDRLEIFQYDSTKQRHVTVFLDFVDFGSRITFRDLTQDGADEIIVQRDSKEDNPIVSRGMNIYGWTSGSRFQTFFLSDNGDPRVEDLDSDRVHEILTSSVYFGALPEGDSIIYTAGIYIFDGETYSPNNPQFGSYYSKHIARAVREYERLKQKVRRMRGDPAPVLYRSFLESIIWLRASGNIQRVRFLWDRESSFLEGYLELDQYEDLEYFMEDLDTSMFEEQTRPRIDA